MAKEKTKILVIDDDPKVSWILNEGLYFVYHKIVVPLSLKESLTPSRALLIVQIEP